MNTTLGFFSCALAGATAPSIAAAADSGQTAVLNLPFTILYPFLRDSPPGHVSLPVHCADRWERAAFLEPRLPHQHADTNPRDSGLQRFVRRPDSDPRAPWRPPVPANPAQGSLATETANPTLVETLRCLADRVRPERATQLKPGSTAP